MFYLNRETELTAALLEKMINRFHLNVEPKLRKYRNYYDGIHNILNKNYVDASKPCARAVTNIIKNITDSYCGYLATPGNIAYSSSEDISEIMDVLRYNDHQAEDADFLLDALIYGVAAELVYMDAQGQVRFRTISPAQCFGVYDDSLTGDLMYFVRMYKTNEWDDSDIYSVDVYGDHSIKHYSMQGMCGSLSLINEEPHYFSQCPANIFHLPDEKSIFDCVMSLQDTYNDLLSAEVDDYSAFCDAYLVLEGVDADADDIAAMKKNRVLVLPEGAKASYLTKSAQDAQIEKLLDRLHSSIYRIASCVDFSLENVGGGVSSGIAIKYRLTGMESRAGKIEAEMKKALQRRVEIISGIASLKLGEEVFRDIEITFERNIPTDNAEIVNLVNSLSGVVSDRTLLSMVPAVTDVEAELEALKEQKAANMQLYSFGSAFGGNDSDEDDA